MTSPDDDLTRASCPHGGRRRTSERARPTADEGPPRAEAPGHGEWQRHRRTTGPDQDERRGRRAGWRAQPGRQRGAILRLDRGVGRQRPVEPLKRLAGAGRDGHQESIRAGFGDGRGDARGSRWWWGWWWWWW